MDFVKSDIKEKGDNMTIERTEWRKKNMMCRLEVTWDTGRKMMNLLLHDDKELK